MAVSDEKLFMDREEKKRWPSGNEMICMSEHYSIHHSSASEGPRTL